MPFIENDDHSSIFQNRMDDNRHYFEMLLNFFNVSPKHHKRIFEICSYIYIYSMFISFIALCILILSLYFTRRIFEVGTKMIPICILFLIHFMYTYLKETF